MTDLRRPSELDILRAAIRSLTFRPLRQSAHFSCTRSSNYRTVVVAVAVITAIELPALHLLLATQLPESWKAVSHAALLLLHVYGLLWVIGDWRLMREGGLEIDNEGLRVALGARWNGLVSPSNIASVTAGEVDELSPLSSEKGDPEEVRVTPWDTPNVTVELREPTSMATYFGRTHRGRRLMLFADDPRAVTESLRRLVDAEDERGREAP